MENIEVQKTLGAKRKKERTGGKVPGLKRAGRGGDRWGKDWREKTGGGK